MKSKSYRNPFDDLGARINEVLKPQNITPLKCEDDEEKAHGLVGDDLKSVYETTSEIITGKRRKVKDIVRTYDIMTNQFIERVVYEDEH